MSLVVRTFEMAASAASTLTTTHEDLPLVGPDELPLEAWCKSISYVVRSHCLPQICPISRFFRRLAGELLSWEGASVVVRTNELEETDGRPRFDPLIPQWSLCSQIFADFKDAEGGAKRRAARRCFSLLSQHCTEATGLFFRNWCLMERDGLPGLCGSFPGLRHLELWNCDYLSHANCIRIFAAHPDLLSLKATFSPKAKMTPAFVEAAPRGLMALAYVNFGTDGADPHQPQPVRRAEPAVDATQGPPAADVLAALLARCPLEHLWLARTAGFSPAISAALAAAPRPLRTISLPESTQPAQLRRADDEAANPDEAIVTLVRACPHLELLCCWGEGSGLSQLEDFERLPSPTWNGRIILRRRGSQAELHSNGTFWAPYSRSGGELMEDQI